MGKSGFNKPEWPIVPAGTAPTLTAWQQDPTTFVPDRCMARKTRSDRDRRWSVGMTCQWQCGDKVAAGGLCGKCLGHKAKNDSGTAAAHNSWYGLITEAPPCYAELFWGGVYRVGHLKTVIPKWSEVARPAAVRPRLTEEEKAARVASGGAGGPAKAARGLGNAARDAAMGLKLLKELRDGLAKDLAARDSIPAEKPKLIAALQAQADVKSKKLAGLEAEVFAEHIAKVKAKEAELKELLAFPKVEGDGADDEAVGGVDAAI